uniref:BPI1 domain-containing protein n=1 Tax=Strongyloides venezuelensis TaxID=75913 RepID=A0A0K0FPQ5_STRVS
MIIKLLLLTFLSIVCLSKIEAVGQIQVNKSGLEYFAKIGIKKLTGIMENVTIPSYSGIGPQRLSYNFTDINVTSFKVAQKPKSLSLFGPKRLTVTFRNLKIKMSVKYTLKYKNNLTITDNGSFDIYIYNGSLCLGMDIFRGDPFQIHPSVCNVNLNNTDPIEVSGKIEPWIYDEFNTSIEKYIKPNLVSTLCDNYEYLLENYSKKLIKKVNEPIEIDKNNIGTLSGFFVDYTFPSIPYVDNKFGIEIPIVPIIYNKKAIDIKSNKYIAKNFTSEKHICIDLDFANFAEYLIETISKSPTIQTLGHDLIRRRLPNKVQDFFSCGCEGKGYCISDIIPDLNRFCSNYTKVSMIFDSFKLTNINVENDVIYGNSSQVVSFEIDDNNKTTKLFQLELYPEYILKRHDIQISNNKISGEVDIDVCKFKIISSPKIDIEYKGIKKIIEIGLKDYMKM